MYISESKIGWYLILQQCSVQCSVQSMSLFYGSRKLLFVCFFAFNLHSHQLHLTGQWWLTLRMESSAKIFWYHKAEAQHIQKDMPGMQPQEVIQQQMQNKTGIHPYLFTRLLEGWVNDLPFDLIHFIVWYRKKKRFKKKKHLKWIASRNWLPWGNKSLNRCLLSRSGKSRGHSVGSLIGCTVVIYLRE